MLTNTELKSPILIRIKFEKQGALRFIGHLDLMRTFQKTFRRADIPIAYSEGYNPHQIFSIASPLTLGIGSVGEYLDLKLKESMDLDDLISAINNASPEGIKVTAAVMLEEKAAAGMAAVLGASYTITGKINDFDLDGLLSKETITVTKKTKKGKLKEMDIKPGIFGLVHTTDGLVFILS
jgi:radical SAM-linked protein